MGLWACCNEPRPSQVCRTASVIVSRRQLLVGRHACAHRRLALPGGGGGCLLAAFLGVAGQFWPFGRQAVHRKLQYGV